MSNFIKEIKSTLKEEKSNNFDGHHDEDYNKGWIEALEYVINTYNLYNKSYKENKKYLKEC